MITAALLAINAKVFIDPVAIAILFSLCVMERKGETRKLSVLQMAAITSALRGLSDKIIMMYEQKPVRNNVCCVTRIRVYRAIIR